MTLAARDVHVSIDDDSKPLLTGNDEGIKKLGNSGSTMDRKKKDSASCSTLKDEVVTGEKAEAQGKPEVEGRVLNHYEKEPTQPTHGTQNGCHSNMEQEEDFSAKDLLSFAWQIARGMVCCQSWEL